MIDNKNLMPNNRWETPKLFGVGLFTDLNMYKEALIIADQFPIISANILQEELPQRVKGLMLVEGFKKRAFTDLLRELVAFNFIQKESNKESTYSITQQGLQFLSLSHINENKAKNLILQKTQEVFVTPAWFIERLWSLNPEGQGQVVIPTPVKEWKVESRSWKDNDWFIELEEVSRLTYKQITTVLPGSFPYSFELWLSELKEEYKREGNTKPRKNIQNGKINNERFNPRVRLSMAMKTVTVRHFFSRKNPITNLDDFTNDRSNMTHRSFSIWCPRLESFGLLFYTDYKPEIPGRLIFPTSVFKKSEFRNEYERKDMLINPSGEYLFVYTPQWDSVSQLFINSLYDVYEYFYNKEGIIYISLQNIRDETCRQLRIGPGLFESFLGKAYALSLQKSIQYSISLETDLRQDMRVQLNRRGVYIDKILYTLIAIKKYL